MADTPTPPPHKSLLTPAHTPGSTMPNITRSNHASQPERFCKYIHRFCNQTRLDGYDYCIRHILEDKTAPFKQCSFVNPPNKKRCSNAAPKGNGGISDNPLCPFHAKRAYVKSRSESRRSMYCTPVYYTREDTDITKRDKQEPKPPPTTLEQVEGFFEDGETVISESRIENIDDDYCGAEKYGDCLEHAGVYTFKEVCTIAKEKVTKLHNFYCDELKVLYRELKESRRKFLASVAKPVDEEVPEEQKSPKLVYRDLREVKGRLLARIEKPSTSTAVDKVSNIDTTLLQTLTRYHCRSGLQRIFRRRVLERRAGLSRPDKPTCVYEKDELRCPLPALAATKFCRNHILLDPKQVLYVPCEEGKCRKPVLPIEEKVACDAHFSCVLGYKMEEDIPEPSISVLPFENSLHLMAPPEAEHFQSMDDIASLGLDAIGPGPFLGLDQFGEPGESETVNCEDELMPISLHPPSDIMSGSESD